MKRTLIINHKYMDAVGGIGTFIYLLVQRCHNLGYRIIWLRRKRVKTASIFESIMNDRSIVETKELDSFQIHLFKSIMLSFTNDEEIVVVSFTFQDHARSLMIKKRYSNFNVKCFYLIPHFTGSSIYPELDFPFLHDNITKLLSHIYQKWIMAGNILFFSQSHIDALEKEYRFNIPPIFKRLVPKLDEALSEFNQVEVLKRYKQKEFKIVSACRFDFPHKGFIIGLIKEYAKLKEKYPEIILYIIGDGDGIQKIHDEINKLKDFVRRDIHVCGMMSLKNLIDFYKTCNLSICVAGCAYYSARAGLVTLPARHYTYECEVYGFLPESKDYLTETKPGFPVADYIEKVIGMNEEEYLEYSRKAYDTFKEMEESDGSFLFTIKEVNPNYDISQIDLCFIRWICWVGKIIKRINNT